MALPFPQATLTPMNEDARDWIAEHLPEEVTRWGHSIVIEPRYFDDIVEGIIGDDLTIA